MARDGQHDPVTHLIILGRDGVVVRDGAGPADGPTSGPGEDSEQYDALLELDRLEELLEAMGELGATSRAEVEELTPGPASVEVLAEMDALGVRDTAQLERRMAELESWLGDE